MKFVRYTEKDSFLHSLDPRAEAFICLTLISLTFVFSHPLALFFIFCGMLFVVKIGELGREFLRRLKFLLPVAIMAFVLWSFFNQYSLFESSGARALIFEFGPLQLSNYSILYGLSMSFKILVLIGTPIVFFLTVRNSDFVASLVEMKIPYKIAFGIGLTLRMIGVFEDEMSNIKQAQMSRGLDLESGNLLSRVRKNIPVIIPTIFNGITISEQLSTSMNLKGFGVKEKRTNLKSLDFTSKDWSVVAICFSILIVSILLRVNGMGVIG